MVLKNTKTPSFELVMELAITINATQPNKTPILMKLSRNPFKNSFP